MLFLAASKEPLVLVLLVRMLQEAAPLDHKWEVLMAFSEWQVISERKLSNRREQPKNVPTPHSLLPHNNSHLKKPVIPLALDVLQCNSRIKCSSDLVRPQTT